MKQRTRLEQLGVVVGVVILVAAAIGVVASIALGVVGLAEAVL